VDLRPPRGVCAQRLELRAEQQHVARPPVIQWFLAQAISDQMQAVLQTVDEGKREHPSEALRGTYNTLVLDGCKHHLGVRLTPKAGPSRFELCPQLAEVVDLAVEDD